MLGHVREAQPASVYEVEIGSLAIIPRRTSSEHLMLAPGVLTANHGGEGHANETFMRGFAAREGQDIEFLVEGVPINEVSNAHGHGYADLLFVPPELVRRVSVTEGAFDPEQGDFAFAGTARFELGARRRGATVTSGYGSWNTQRLLLSYAPLEVERPEFGGFEYYRSDGYGTNRAAQHASAFVKTAGALGEGGARWRAAAFGYGARWDQPGVLRENDYRAGRVGLYDSYDSNQGGESKRFLVLLGSESEGNFEQTTYFQVRAFRNRANFTGWTADQAFVDSGGGEQRGDGVEQRYRVATLGSRGVYSVAEVLGGRPQVLSLGYSARYDTGRSEQHRIRAVTTIPYLTVFDRELDVANLAGFVRANVRALDWLTLRGGVRVDAFAFGVRDLDEPEADREGTRVPSQTSEALGLAVSPRGTVEARVVRGLSVLTSYGRAVRSTEAAALSDNEPAPFATAEIFDAGVRHRHGRPARGTFLETQASYSYTRVNRDLLFDEVAARNVEAGASTRHAVLTSTRLRVRNTWDTLFNMGYARATLDATGELLPYIPELVMRLDSAVQGTLDAWTLGGVPVHGHLGAGVTYVPARPLPYQERSDPVLLANLGGELRLYHTTVGLEARNLLGLRYRQSEFNFPSNFASPASAWSRAPERHFVAGEPLFVLLSLTLHVEEWIRSGAGA